VYINEGDIEKVETKLHVKYTKEGRFYFDIAAVKLLDGTVEGRRCRAFDYSAKNLITITAEENMVREEIKRVKALGTGGQWVETRNRLPGILYEEDSITTMDKIAETTKAKFERHGIATVMDMKMISAATISAIKGDTYFRLSEQALKRWEAEAEKSH
jgi:hypothetical protein